MIQKNRLLPDEYQEVEYLESTGTQYIITNWSNNGLSNFSYDIKFTDLGSPNSSGYWGPYNLEVRCGTIWVTADKFTISVGGTASNQSKIFIPKDENIHIWNVSVSTLDRKYSSIIDGENYGPYIYSSNNAPTSAAKFSIFRSFNKSSQYPPVKARIYYFKAYNDAVLELSIIPCYRKSDNKPGMYDLISGEFFTNQGTGEFIVGPDVVNTAKHIYKGNYVLPEEYEEVEYLDNNSSADKAYIITDWLLTPNFSLAVDLEFKTLGLNAQYRALFGSQVRSASADGYAVFIKNSATPGIIIDTGNAANTTSFILKTDTRYSVIWNASSMVVNQTSYTLNNPLGRNISVPFALFGVNRNGAMYNPDRTPQMRLYSATLIEGQQIVHNLIPVFRKADSKPGMYDTISGQFYMNSGSGEFIAGPKVKKKVKFIIKDNRVIFADESLLPSEYRRVRSIKGTGTQYIDTNILLNDSSICIDMIGSPDDNNCLFWYRQSTTPITTLMCGFHTGNSDIRIASWSGGSIGKVHDGTTYAEIPNKEENRLTFFSNGNYITCNGVTVKTRAYSPKNNIVNPNSNETFKFPYRYLKDIGGRIIQKAKIEFLVITRQNNMLIYLIPSVRNSDNKPGMYDLVSGEFFTNQGTGEFEWEEL